MTDMQAAVTNGQIVSLYTHFKALLEEQEKRFDERFAAIKEASVAQHEATEQALRIASDALTIRLEAHNGLQKALDEMARQMARQSDLEAAITGLRTETQATLNPLLADVRTLREGSLLTATKNDIRPLEDYRIALDAKASTKQVGEIEKQAAQASKMADVSNLRSWIGTGLGVLSIIVTLIRWAMGG